MRFLGILCSLATLVVTGLTLVGAEAGPAQQPAAIDSARNYFAPPAFADPEISPDGTSVAFIARRQEHACLFRLNLGTKQVDGIFDPGGGEVEKCWWLGDRRLLFAAIGEFGRSYFIQDLDGSEPRLIQPLEHLPLEWIHPIAGDFDHLMAVKFDPDRLPLVGSFGFTRRWTDLYIARVDLPGNRATHLGSLEPDENSFSLARNPADAFLQSGATESGHDAVFSSGGELRAKVAIVRGHWHVMWRTGGAKSWHELSGSESYPPFVPVAMAADDRHLIVIAHDQGDTTAVMQLDPDTDQRVTLGQRPDRDVEQIIWDPSQHYAVGVSFFNFGPADEMYFDGELGQLQSVLQRSLPATVNRVVSESADRRRCVVESSAAGLPPKYFLLERAAGRLSELGEEYPESAGVVTARHEYFQYLTHDGVTEKGGVLLPATGGKAEGFSALVLPIQFVGEKATTGGDYNAAEEYLASRGIAVVRLGVRGYAGFGQKFKSAGDFELSGKVARDIEDGVQFLREQGWTRPGKVALFGDGLGASFALRTAAGSKEIGAVVALNATGYLDVNEIGWLTSSPANAGSLLALAGGSAEAFRRVHEFEPESYMARMTGSVLLINYTWFDGQSSGGSRETARVRYALANHHVKFEEAGLDWHGSEHRPMTDYSAQLFFMVANYVEKTLK
jgi:dipeptidyl aminopeptidase/acylaminoacyl peptidase